MTGWEIGLGQSHNIRVIVADNTGKSTVNRKSSHLRFLVDVLTHFAHKVLLEDIMIIEPERRIDVE